MRATMVLDFWYDVGNQPYWFAKSDAFDEKIRTQFLEVWQQAAAGELVAWRDTLEGRLAEIIVLDQFSRNLHRNTPRAFAQDGMALVLTQEMLRHEGFAALDVMQRKFALMPLMHSESTVIHAAAMPLFADYTDASTLLFEEKHKVIIDRFGRYPHRNAILGRESSAAELEFLQQPGSAF
ncbi:MAG: DUF924 family protein [Cardiobacteriaceae bacterium]|nr:DUF924 family protein [Cardiobacteriaceae bacterium]